MHSHDKIDGIPETEPTQESGDFPGMVKCTGEYIGQAFPVSLMLRDNGSGQNAFAFFTNDESQMLAYSKGDNGAHLAFGALDFIAFESGGFGAGAEVARFNPDRRVVLGNEASGTFYDFTTTGLILNGNNKYQRHIQMPASVAGNVANQPTAVEVGTASGYQFASGGTQEELHFQWEVPEDWDGSQIVVEIDWLPNSGAMTSPAAVNWIFEYRSVAEGESIVNGTMASKSVVYNTTTAQDIIVHSPVTLDDANQPIEIGDHIYFRCYRNTAVANDFAGTVVATAFEINYTSNSFPTG